MNPTLVYHFPGKCVEGWCALCCSFQRYYPVIDGMRRSGKFYQRGSNYDNAFCCFLVVAFCSFGEERIQYHYKRAIISTPARHIGFAALWFFRGSGPVLLRNPIFLWLFSGDGVWTPVPPLDSGMVGLLAGWNLLLFRQILLGTFNLSHSSFLSPSLGGVQTWLKHCWLGL